MRRIPAFAASLLLVAGAALPGCIAVIGDTKDDVKDTPNARALTDLEKRVDRLEREEQQAPK